MKNRLEELRKQRGIKQEDLANALEVSRQTIGSLENGRYNPSIQLAFKIARYFNMSMQTCSQAERCIGTLPRSTKPAMSVWKSSFPIWQGRKM